MSKMRRATRDPLSILFFWLAGAIDRWTTTPCMCSATSSISIATGTRVLADPLPICYVRCVAGFDPIKTTRSPSPTNRYSIIFFATNVLLFATLVQNSCYKVSSEIGLASIPQKFCYEISKEFASDCPFLFLILGEPSFASIGAFFFAATKQI
jgi:hypothetical protein